MHRPTLTEAYHGEQWMHPQEESYLCDLLDTLGVNSVLYYNFTIHRLDSV